MATHLERRYTRSSQGWVPVCTHGSRGSTIAVAGPRPPTVSNEFSKRSLGDKFGPFVVSQETLGFIPNLLQAQTLLPRVIEAQAMLENAVRLRKGTISTVQKERILLSVATQRQVPYCVAVQARCTDRRSAYSRCGPFRTRYRCRTNS
jgi:hypothetical protein